MVVDIDAGIPTRREQRWSDAVLPGDRNDSNQSLEKVLHAVVVTEPNGPGPLEASHRGESCGCHLRSGHQMDDGEARRSWDQTGPADRPIRAEPLAGALAQPIQRSHA